MSDTTSHIAKNQSFPPNGWVETTLGDVAEIKGGKRLPKGENLVPYKTNHPYIRITDLENNQIKKNQLQFVTDEVFQSISRYIVNTGDVIVSIVGSIGFVALIDEDLNNVSLTENCVKFVNLKNLDSKFLYYFLISRDGQGEINKNTVGAVQKKLPIYGVQNIKLSLPPLPEQQAIASVLSAFDDKIELLREQNKKLEELGQTIFQEWFGKYGLDDELPEGWRVGKLGEIVKFVQGTQVPSEYQIEEQKENYDKFLRIVDYMSNFSEKPRYIPKKDSNTYCNEDEIIMVRYGEVGFVGRRMSGVFANNLFKILPKEPINNDFLYYFLKSNDIQQYIKNNSAGSALPAIKHSTVGDIELIVPSKQVLEDFRDFAQKTERKISDNNSQIQSLARTRDELLPRLMSGEVRVKI